MFKLILVAFLSLFNVEQGQAAYYNPGRFEQVVAVRQAGWTANPLPEELPPVIGFVARQDCSEIGQLLWICHESEGCQGPYLTADCANRIENHHKVMKRKNIVVETDYAAAARWGVVGFGPQDIDVIVISRRLGSMAGPGKTGHDMAW